MQLSNFTFPYAQPLFDVPFVAAHPELRCKARDGSFVEFLSYAYPQIRAFMVETLLESARQGFDGVQLIFTRGQHVLFEEPAQARFREKYGTGTDFCRLPAGDPRLAEIRSDVMTDFLTELRQALNDWAAQNGKEPAKIYITGYFSVEESLADGLDIERFAREGLIDGVIQSNMSVWEEIDDVLGADGLVDLEKYVEKARRDYVMRRTFYNNVPKTVAGLPAYRRIADRYGIALYSELPWECTEQAEAYVKAAQEIYAAGGDRIALWDCYPSRVQCLSEWNADAHLGDAARTAQMSTDTAAYHRIIKVLSFGGCDQRIVHPSWRG